MKEGKKLNKKQFSSRLRNKFNVADSDNFCCLWFRSACNDWSLFFPRNDCLCSCSTKHLALQLIVAKTHFAISILSILRFHHSFMYKVSITRASDGNSANWNIIRCFYFWREPGNSKPLGILVWDEQLINSRCRIFQTNLNQFVAFRRILSEVVSVGDL